MFFFQAVEYIFTSAPALSTGVSFHFIINNSSEKQRDSSVCSPDSTRALYCTLSVISVSTVMFVPVCLCVDEPLLCICVTTRCLRMRSVIYFVSFLSFLCLLCQHVGSQRGIHVYSIKCTMLQQLNKLKSRAKNS